MEPVTPAADPRATTRALARATGQPLVIRRVPLASLHLDPVNARSHPERNLESIKASLARFGQAEPLVVLKHSGRVLGGNGRLMSMKALGWTECDVVELELSEIEATALGIALNRTAELADWNESTLAQLLGTLRDEDALDGVGFSTDEIDELLADLDAQSRTPGDVDDPGPETPPVEPVSRAGDLWLLGDHRLLCGDSTQAESIARVLAGDKAALMATDPPYCVNYTGNDRPIHNGSNRSANRAW